MVLCLMFIFLAVNFDWSIILIRKSFGAFRHISGKLGVKLANEVDINRISVNRNGNISNCITISVMAK